MLWMQSAGGSCGARSSTQTPGGITHVEMGVDIVDRLIKRHKHAVQQVVDVERMTAPTQARNDEGHPRVPHLGAHCGANGLHPLLVPSPT